MSSTYYLTLGRNGYESAITVEKKYGDAFRRIIDNVLAEPNRILDEVKRVEGLDLHYRFLEAYLHGSAQVRWATFDGKRAFMQIANGGGVKRKRFAAMRRAFCRLVLAAAHKDGLEVNMTVA